jgi:MFS family permease
MLTLADCLMDGDMLLRLRSGLMLDNRRVLYFMLYNALLHVGMFGIADVALNFYFVSLGYDVATIALLQSVPRISGVLTSIPMGMVNAKVGSYRVMLYCTLGCALCFVMMVLFPYFWVIVASRFLLGFFYGAQQIALAPLMGALVESTRHTHFFAYHNVISMLSMAFGSFIGGAMPALLVTMLAPILPVAAASGAESPFAYGAALMVAGILVVLSAVTFAPVKEPEKSEQAALVTGSGSKEKLQVPWRLLFIMTLPMIPFGFTGGLTFPFFNLFFRTQFGVADQVVGVILSIGWLGMAFIPMINSTLEKRFGHAQALGITMTMACIGFFWLSMAPTLAWSVVGFVIGISFRNTMQPLFQPLLMSRLPSSLHSFVSSLSNIMWNIGWLTATSSSGMLQTTIGFRAIMDLVAVGTLFTGLCIVFIYWHRTAVQLRAG